MPIVADATAKADVTKRYKEMSGKNAGISKLLGDGKSIDLGRYVTIKSMNGLYHYVAEQEKDIRKNQFKKRGNWLRKV